MMNKKNLPHIITVASFVVFIVLGLACASSSASVKSASSVDEVIGLRNKLDWLKYNAQTGGNYVLEVYSDEGVMFYNPFGGHGDLSYKDKSDITITIRGDGQNRTLHNVGFGPEPGYIFNVGSGVTLILDENITLKGSKTEKLIDAKNSRSVVVVSSGGTLVMNDGSTITGNTRRSLFLASEKIEIKGAGVYVSDGGTFLMKGGTISGNTIRPVLPDNQAVNAAGIKEITFVCRGSGVYVSGEGRTLFLKEPTPSGTFVKTGGTITGYSSDPENGNVVKDPNGNVLNGHGHAVFLDGKEPKAIDTTVGPEITLHFSGGTFREGRNKEPNTNEEQ